VYTFSTSYWAGTKVPTLQNAPASTETFFGARRLAPLDRLGSARSVNNTASSYYPFGEDKSTNPAIDAWKFGTYWRDSASGLDYAVNRYYSSSLGRFLTSDPSRNSPGLGRPQNWNRYSYAGADPVNNLDPTGEGWYCIDGGYFTGSGMSSQDCYWQNDPDTPPCVVTSGFDPTPGSPDPACNEPGAPPPPPAQTAPKCSITEYERPVAGVAVHTYLDVSDPALGINDILEGGPTMHPVPPNPYGGNWGQLNGLISGTFESNTVGNLPLKGDNPATNQFDASLTGGSSVCFDVLELISSVLAYGNGSESPYLPVPRGSYRNSNSFTYTLLASVGIISSSWTPVGWAPGWGLVVPGLGISPTP
jgi:RHS repeat-associated protein